MSQKINCFKAYDARGKVPDELNAEITMPNSSNLVG